MKEQLFVKIGGSYKEVDLPKPSGITLKFVSNMFNDLSKFCASYSFSFNLPKTITNINIFDMIDDSRHKSEVYGKKIECQYLRDGINITNNAFLYISEVDKSYKCAMTWNVLSWLMEIADSGIKLNDFEEGVDKKDLTLVQAFSAGSPTGETTTTAFTMGDSYIKRLNFCCGRGSRMGDGATPPCIPVRYLLDRIAQKFGYSDATKIFSFLESSPITSQQIDAVDGKEMTIFQNGVVPLIKTEWSQTLLEIKSKKAQCSSVYYYGNNTKRVPAVLSGSNLFAIDFVGNYTFVRLDKIQGDYDLIELVEDAGYADKADDGSWTKTSKPSSQYIGFRTQRNLPCTMTLLGSINVERTIGTPVLRFVKFTYISGGKYEPVMNGEEIVEYVVEAESEGGNVYSFTFDPSAGRDSVELESRTTNDDFYAIVIDGENFVNNGSLLVSPSYGDGSTFGYVNEQYTSVDLFANMPDITLIDFLKSLFYIENSYPVIDRDGRIGIEKYSNLYKNAFSRDFYDWSNKLLGLAPQNATQTFSNGLVGRANYFLMNGCSDTDPFGDKKEEGALTTYERGYGYFETENDTIELKKTIYTFPFAPKCIISQSGMYCDSYSFWKRIDKSIYYEYGSPKPIIGNVIVKEQNSGSGDKRYFWLDTWNVTKIDYDNSVFAKIFKRPRIIKAEILLDLLELNAIDFSKPVYIDRYNTFFAIVSIQLGSSNVAKVELIKLPIITKNEVSGESEDYPQISIDGQTTYFKKDGYSVRPKFVVEAKCNIARIENVSIYLDEEELYNGSASLIDQAFSINSGGTHYLKIVATGSNGLVSEKTQEVEVRLTSNDPRVEFSVYPSSVTNSYIYNNVNDIVIGLYNVEEGNIAKIELDITSDGLEPLHFEGSGRTLSTSWITDYASKPLRDYNNYYISNLNYSRSINFDAKLTMQDGSSVSNSKIVKVFTSIPKEKSNNLFYDIEPYLYIDEEEGRGMQQNGELHNAWNRWGIDYEGQNAIVFSASARYKAIGTTGYYYNNFYSDIRIYCYDDNDQLVKTSYRYCKLSNSNNVDVVLNQSEFGSYKKIEIEGYCGLISVNALYSGRTGIITFWKD